MPISSKMFTIKNFRALQKERRKLLLSNDITVRYRIEKKFKIVSPMLKIRSHLKKISLSSIVMVFKN